MINPSIFKWARWITLGSTAMTGVAMALYAGGTVHDPSRTGYSFFQNALSDLGSTVSQGGKPNHVCAVLFGISFTVLALTFAVATLAFVQLYSSSRMERLLARCAGAAGLLSCLGLIGGAVTPQNLYLSLHILFASFAHAGCLLTSLFFAAATSGDPHFPRGVPIAWLLLGVVIIGHYCMHWGPGIDTDLGLTIQATGQKATAISILVVFIYQSYRADRVAAGLTKE